jgi:hypothetical protein
VFEGEMLRKTGMDFRLKLVIYLTPFALGFFLLTGVLVYVGESMPLGTVVAMQQADEKVLFRYQYGNRDQAFKLLSANTRRADVLAVGSSRILQFRAGFFNRNPDAFYNAAAPAWRLEQVEQLVYGLEPDALPKVLILAIDPPWFNDDYEGDEFPKPLSDYENLFLVNRSFLQDFLGGVDFSRPGFNTRSYLQRREPGGSGGTALGLRAIRDGHGFRSDGSEQYGDFLVAGWLTQTGQRDVHIRWMQRGRDMYVYGETVSETALTRLSALLDYAAKHDITVIGFLPSYAPNLWERMMRRGRHTYITALTPRLQALFDARGFVFFDFSDGASVDTRTWEFFDGWHASELSNLRLYLKMLEALPDVLGEYSDLTELRQISLQATNTWNVFGMDSTFP